VSGSQRLLAVFFVVAGAMHFAKPRAYGAVMPRYLPLHRELVLASGAAEILGGLAVVPGRTRRLAGWWLLAVLAAVFPANVHMAVNPDQIPGLEPSRVPRWLLWARLPVQPLLMVWAWRSTHRA
jgi:uncharacterized membrane protein